MKYLLDSAAMKKIDEYSIKTTGIPSVVLMERAALSVSSFVEKLAYNKKGNVQFLHVECLPENFGDTYLCR